MKKILLTLTFMLFTSVCFADVYVVVNENKEIVTMSQKNDNILSGSQELVVLPGGFGNYELADNPTNYFYKNGKFILNTKKINDQETAKIELAEKEKEKVLIDKETQNQAVKALKDKGVVLKYYEEE